MLNNIFHWIILLLLDINQIMDNTLTNILFTEPKNKSDHTGLWKQEDFPKEELKGTQSTNDWENKEVEFQ